MFKTHIILGIYVRFRGGVGLLASFDLNNHQASSCCSMRRLRRAAAAAWFQGAKKTPWLRYGYLSQAGGRTGRSTLKPYLEVQDTGCNWLYVGFITLGFGDIAHPLIEVKKPWLLSTYPKYPEPLSKEPFVKKDGHGETTTSEVKVWNPHTFQ